VRIAIEQARHEHQDRTIEQRLASLIDVLQPLNQVRELLHVILIRLQVHRLEFRDVAVVREVEVQRAVTAFQEFEVHLRQVVIQHARRDARLVHLERKHDQIHHQLHVIRNVLRNLVRRTRHVGLRQGRPPAFNPFLLRRGIDARLDRPHRLQILVQLLAISAADLRTQIVCLLQHRVENAAIQLAQNNKAELTKALGRPPTDAELYLAHQQGAEGASGLLSNPNAPASSIVGAKAVLSNGGNLNMTAGQFANLWLNKYNGTSVGSSGGGLNPGGYTEGTPSAGGVAPANAGTNAVGGIQPEGQGGLSGWASNPDNRNLLLSVLSGLGGMAGSNSRYLGAAMLQGLGAGANTYAGLQKQAADIGQTHARTVTEQQQANLTAAATKQTEAETTKTGVATSAQRYEKTYLPTGIMIRDVTKPNEVPKIIQYGQIDPTTGQIAMKDENMPVGTTTGEAKSGADAGTSVPRANVNEQGLPSPQVPAQIPMTYLQFTPDGQKIAAEEGSSAIATARAQSTSAQQTNQQLADMAHSLAQLPQSGMLAPGSGFGSRLDVAKTINTAAQAMNLGAPFDENAIANGEDLNKQTTRLGFALSRSLGSQEAAGITTRAIESVPGGANSPAGAQRIISSLKAANQRQIDYYNFAQQWVAKTGGAITGMDAAFNKAAPPELYALSAFVPAQAMASLRADPKLAADFDRKYGAGYSKYVLGQ